MQADDTDEQRERQWWPVKDIAAYVRWAKNTIKAGSDLCALKLAVRGMLVQRIVR